MSIDYIVKLTFLHVQLECQLAGGDPLADGAADVDGALAGLLVHLVVGADLGEDGVPVAEVLRLGAGDVLEVGLA